jgi:hypothetical protein
MTDNKTKLLKMIEETLYRSPPDNPEATAQNVVDSVADWFEEVLEQIGIQPSCIPTLLRWQAHQHEYLSDEI